jgi:hypothetical protein
MVKGKPIEYQIKCWFDLYGPVLVKDLHGLLKELQ